MKKMTKTSNQPFLLAIGILISLLTVISLPGFYFHKDLEVLWKWAQIWDRNWQEIYVACSDCNYPFLGMISSAGVLNLLRGLSYDKAIFAYRLFLGIIDGLNVLLIYWMLKRLSVKKAEYWAGIIGISISSWAGGALWGQIDGISQFFILLTLAWMVGMNTKNQLAMRTFRLNLAISGILLAGTLLVKQLTLFSVFSLGLLLAASILANSRKWKLVALNGGTAVSAFLATIFAGDFFLELREPYLSHFYYVWKEGFFQKGIISGNGFNIWMFLGHDMWSSAQFPLFSNYPFLTPYNTGIVIFGVLVLVLTASLVLFLKEQFKNGEKQLNRETILNFIFYIAIINLCFNVFLTGTRDRYLYHFYPFVLIAWAGLAGYSRLFSEKIQAVLVLGASLYGIFILLILSSIDFRIGTIPHLIMGIFHLVLFTWLMFVILRYQNFFKSIGLIFKKSTKNLPTVR